MSVPPDNLLLLNVEPLQLPGVLPSELDPAVRSYLQDLYSNLVFYTDAVNQAINILLQVVQTLRP